MAEFLIVVVLVLGAWLCFVIVKNRMPQSSSAGADVRSRAEYKRNGSFGTKGGLIIRERHPSLLDAIQVEASHDINVGYTPDKYIFTSATVGGITTGGVSKIDGGYHASLGAKNGSYYLSYKYAQYNQFNDMRWSSGYVGAVSLNDTDYRIAMNNPTLKRYISDENSISYYSTGYDAIFTNLEARHSLSLSNMSKSDAEYVKSWLCRQI